MSRNYGCKTQTLRLSRQLRPEQMTCYHESP
jgi:hypothetical protein